jgi:hypothetical protein
VGISCGKRVSIDAFVARHSVPRLFQVGEAYNGSMISLHLVVLILDLGELQEEAVHPLKQPLFSPSLAA